jgi:RHS repeat-associated protein
VSEAHLPDSGTDRYAHDVAGRVQTHFRAAGPNVGYSFDGAGRVRQIGYADRFGVRPGRLVRWTYDPLGRVSRIEDSAGRNDLTYDAADRVATDARAQDGRTYVVGYTRDGLGNLVELTYPSGMRVRLERDAADPAKLSRIVAVDGGSETILADEITYTAAGLLTGYTAGNGLRYAIERGPGGRIARITTGLPRDPTPDVLDLTYQYDATGNITAILDAVDPERTAYYRHDPLDRLVEADGWWGTLGWTYDRTGNRLAEARDGVVSTYAYQAGTSRLLAVTDAATGVVEHLLEYDASGQATRFDDLLLEYDAADRLFRVRDAATGATVQENGYDHAFRRTRRTSYRDAAGVPLPAPACTAFVYDATSRLIAEHDCSAGSPPAPSGNVTAEYVYLEGYAVLAVRRGGAWYGYASDHLATPRKATDATGAVVWDGRLEPFGGVDAATASIDQPLRFPGQYEDGGLGPTYNHHRWYVPGLGRHVAVDPAGLNSQRCCGTCRGACLIPRGRSADFAVAWSTAEPRAVNIPAADRCPATPPMPYVYALDSPIRRTDPSGLDPCDDEYWDALLRCMRGLLPWGGAAAAACIKYAGQMRDRLSIVICASIMSAEFVASLTSCLISADDAELECRTRNPDYRWPGGCGAGLP